MIKETLDQSSGNMDTLVDVTIMAIKIREAENSRVPWGRAI